MNFLFLLLISTPLENTGFEAGNCIDIDSTASIHLELKEGDLLLWITSGNGTLQLIFENIPQACILENEPLPLLYPVVKSGTYRLDIAATDENGYSVFWRRSVIEQASIRDFFEDALVGFSLIKHSNDVDLKRGIELISPLNNLYEAWHEPFFSASLWRHIAMAYRRLGDRKKEKEANQKVINHLAGLGFERWLCETHLYQGQALFALNRYDEAKEMYEGAQKLARDNSFRTLEGTVNNELGLIFNAQGRTYQALACFEKALNLWRDKDLPFHYAMGLQNRGISYQQLGMSELALDSLSEAYQLALDLKDSYLQAVLLIEMGWCKHFLGQNEEAFALIEKALEHGKKLKRPSIEAGALDRMGSIRSQQGRFREAQLFYEQALSQALTDGNSLSVLHARINAARLLVNLRDWEVAEDRLVVIVKQARAKGLIHIESSALHLQAQILWEKKLYKTSLAKNERALTLIEAQRISQPELSIRTSYTLTRNQFYRLHLDILMALGRHEQALSFSERNRSRYFQENSDITRFTQESASLEKARRAIRGLSETRMKMHSNTDEALREHLDREIRSALYEYDRLRASTYKKSAKLLLMENKKNDLVHYARDHLDGGTALLIYGMGDHNAYVWIISKKAFRAIQLAESVAINQAIENYHSLVKRRPQRIDRVPLQKEARHLSDLILKPIGLEELPSNLIIIPDGLLHQLPFGALPLPGKNALLLQTHHIQMSPIFPSEFDESEKGLIQEGSFLLAGDPVYQASDVRFGKRTSTSHSLPSVTERTIQLGRLPASELELDAITGIISGTNHTQLRSFDANLDRLKRTLHENRYDVLHFAAHGIANTHHPSLSGLLFSTLDEHHHSIGGLWTAQEIAASDLRSQLVVLSACQTAQGKSLGIQGHASLCNAFLLSGCTSVIASLWNVDDRAGAYFMGNFYSGMIEQGLSPSHALRETQLTMMQHPRYHHPYYWAPFVFFSPR